jgi:hypothetical protein
MIKYILFKHFFKYSEYIEDILTEITCNLIKQIIYHRFEYLLNVIIYII